MYGGTHKTANDHPHHHSVLPPSGEIFRDAGVIEQQDVLVGTSFSVAGHVYLLSGTSICWVCAKVWCQGGGGCMV